MVLFPKIALMHMGFSWHGGYISHVHTHLDVSVSVGLWQWGLFIAQGQVTPWNVLGERDLTWGEGLPRGPLFTTYCCDTMAFRFDPHNATKYTVSTKRMCIFRSVMTSGFLPWIIGKRLCFITWICNMCVWLSATCLNWLNGSQVCLVHRYARHIAMV